MRKEVLTKKAPPPSGVYSQAIRASGEFVFVSGQGPEDPATHKLKLGSFREQAEQTFKNVGALLEAAGTSWAHAVKVGVFLKDLKRFQEMNQIYKKFLTAPFPARTTVEAGLLGIDIEVDCVALIPRAKRKR
jgi:2-iminobutanoate/2-iminopropanoate deaminase